MSSPLSGIRVLVTRAADQATTLSCRLESLGATVIEIPMIEIAPPLSWHDLDKALNNIHSYDWIIFASVNAAKSFLERALETAPETNYKQSILNGVKPRVAAIGQSTAKYLLTHGVKVDYLPSEFIAEAFIETFPDYPNLHGLKIVWPRTNLGRDYIWQKMVQAGAEIVVIEAYRTILPKNTNGIAKQLQELLHLRNVEVITFASGETVRNFARVLAMAVEETASPTSREAGEQPFNDGRLFANSLKDVTLVSIGPETTKAMKDCGLSVCLEAESHDGEGLVQAILKRFGNAHADQI